MPMWVALLVALAAASITALLLGLRLRARNRALAQLQRERSLLAAERDQLRRTTERQGQLEQQLLQAKQAAEAAVLAKGEFLATMSHEIRTPLNGILPMLELIARGPLGEDQRQMLATASASSQQLLRIVDDILDYSRLEAQALELEITSFNLRDLLDGVVQLMQRAADAKGLSLGLQLDPSVRLPVRGDPVRLRQVLSNLLANAIKFTARGQVQLRVQRLGEGPAQHQLRFEIIDTGIGIDEALQARLFQSFSQADASTTRIYGGTGLGLAICKRIIDLMHGRIGVQSTPGQGATFWFEIPLLKVPGDLPAMARTPDSLLLFSSDAILQARIERIAAHHGLLVHALAQFDAVVERLRAVPRPGQPAPAWLLVDARARRIGEATLQQALAERGEDDGLQVLWLQDDALPPRPRQRQLPSHFDDAGLHALLAAPVAHARPAALLANAGQGQPTLPPLHLRVLLVEDNTVNRMVAEQLLRVFQCEVRNAADGEQALLALREGDVDVVLMDCQMPVLDGYAATRRWRAEEVENGRPRLPIIAMTANAMAGDRERCLQAGMDDYLSKPIARGTLHALLQRWGGGKAASPVRPSIEPSHARLTADSRRAPSAEHGSALQDDDSRVGSKPQPVLDRDVLDELHAVIGESAIQIVSVFLEDAPAMVQQLQQAAQNGDEPRLQAVAHSLKSSSANVGALSLSSVAQRIEHEARSGSLQRPAVAVALLVAEFARARVALTGYLAQHRAGQAG
ncbi:ATP-binding protein [Stenotrophomonas maltophilia]|uniref:ATP-binding protein n=1 Tax=Stenotrophomonas maltophilia TaxID=40324 RepID=UPI00046AAA42|nr:ATP-binding protein [Stenotrophomonas maltophilia]OMP40842.1 hybrid sensor histidine kinase/response regulator [Stenotrophomonas sp. KAs 5-3]OOD12505.1 hybrid sensor histidine kinase/response regulator [Stenotrophomonas maltophilia]QQA82227.1 response regulator [Stenotrophomonas maltophilia]WQE23407.1 ATP-binding protein [Stenotrophomonas maltophilia]HDS1019037.1 response regulator [Stenotrophomonas maltophilia]